MRPYYTDPWLTVWQGDCREVLAQMPAESVHCVVTSPPYWGLRDYGVAGQLGLEPTPEEYVANMVAVFREVRRVLRDDGTLWLNLGDSYASHDPGGYREGEFLNPGGRPPAKGQARNRAGNYRPDGLKPKDLVGIPWRVAFALQADGWYLRSDIIWAKPNPMPESVTDRPTKSHEYLFLLAKSPRYYFDAEAVREPFAGEPYQGRQNGAIVNGDRADRGRTIGMTTTARNIRTVWTIATQPYPGAHFATFPRKLVEPCIKAGTSERGVCPGCGAPWARMTSKEVVAFSASPRYSGNGDRNDSETGRTTTTTTTTGWQPTCDHGREPVPAVVLDPFGGSGTTGMVAQSLSRRAVLIDLNGEYLVQAMGRNAAMPLGLGA